MRVLLVSMCMDLEVAVVFESSPIREDGTNGLNRDINLHATRDRVKVMQGVKTLSSIHSVILI